jgi:hypothetical protein
MAFTTPQEGEVQMLNLILNKAAGEELNLRLFSNNVSPGETDTIATYTICSGSGYADINLAHASFTVTGANPSTFAYPQQTFTLSGALTAWGYVVQGATSSKVYFAENFGSAFTIPSGGGTIKVTINGTM